MRTFRLVLLLSVLLAGGVGACLCHRAVTGWEGANHPGPAKQRELDVLQDYAREADALFQQHGRVMTPECEREQEGLRRATQQKLVEARGESRPAPLRRGEQALPVLPHGFRLQGKFVEVEQFEPAAVAGRYPTVLLVHGADGLKSSGEFYRTAASELAECGYAVFLVHYFDRTGHRQVSPKEVKKEDFQAWRETVREAVRYAAGQPGVDKKRIGLVGFSLGAYLALAVAAEPDCPVAAVVELFGGLPKELHAEVKKLPPVLIVHGDKDEVVPVAEAHKLRDLLKARQLTLEVRIYKGVGHVFTGPGGKFQLLDALDAKDRARRFLDTHLQHRGNRE